MSAGEPLQFEPQTTAILSDCTLRARLDLGLDPLSRDVPVGTQFADALRCRVMAWAWECPHPRALVNEVARLANITADLIEGAGRG